METEQAENIQKAINITNVLLTTLVAITAGFALQLGVTGILWFVCALASFYSVGVLSYALLITVVKVIGYILRAVSTYSKLNNEDSRVQILNEIYNRVKK